MVNNPNGKNFTVRFSQNNLDLNKVLFSFVCSHSCLFYVEIAKPLSWSWPLKMVELYQILLPSWKGSKLACISTDEYAYCKNRIVKITKLMYW